MPSPEPAPAPALAGAGPDGLRFGVQLAGVPLVFASGEVLEYLPDAAIHPLPLAPRRLLGLLQLRGHPVAVLQAGDPETVGPASGRVPVLVVGEPPHAAALVVDEAPRPVGLTASAAQSSDDASRPLPGAPVFAGALGRVVRDADGEAWWTVDPARLFDLLASADAAGDSPAGSQ